METMEGSRRVYVQQRRQEQQQQQQQGQGVCHTHTVALPFALKKKYLKKAKEEELWKNSNISPCKKI
jgi:hypothetical protein